MASLGERLADIRTYEGLTQRQVADILGVSQNSISAYETNACIPGIAKLSLFAKHFDVSLDYLVELIDDKIPLNRRDIIVLPRGFSDASIQKAKDYIRLLSLEERSKK